MKCIYKNNLHDTHRRLTRILIHEIRYNTFQNDPLQVCESAVNIKMARKPILCQSVGWFEGQLLRFVSSVLPLAFLSSPSLCCSSNLNISVFSVIKFYNSLLFPAYSPWPSPNTHSQLAELLSFISPILASLVLLEIPPSCSHEQSDPQYNLLTLIFLLRL